MGEQSHGPRILEMFSVLTASLLGVCATLRTVAEEG
jgi:hypothetical protein